MEETKALAIEEQQELMLLSPSHSLTEQIAYIIEQLKHTNHRNIEVIEDIIYAENSLGMKFAWDARNGAHVGIKNRFSLSVLSANLDKFSLELGLDDEDDFIVAYTTPRTLRR